MTEVNKIVPNIILDENNVTKILKEQLRDYHSICIVPHLSPTPKAQEARGNCSDNRHKFNLTDKIAELASPTSRTSQLNPLFVAEMMGYPLEWLTLPFLSQSGEVEASKR